MRYLFPKGINTLLFLLTFTASFSQTYEYPWSISAGSSMLTYQAHPSGARLSPLPYSPSLELGASRYLNGGFDFRTRVSLSPAVNFPDADGFFKSQLIDMSYQLAFKFNNGVFLKRDAFLGPYFLFGIGGSYVQNHPDAYVPLGGGIRFKLNQRFSIRAETTKKISLNKDHQSLAHAIAFVYNLDTKDMPEEFDPENTSEQEMLVLLQDSDLDGIIDMKDTCPNIAGKGLNGCPEEEKTAIASLDSLPTDNSLANATEANILKDTTANIPTPVIAANEDILIEKPVPEDDYLGKIYYPEDEENTFGPLNQTSLSALNQAPIAESTAEIDEDFEEMVLSEGEDEDLISDNSWGDSGDDDEGLFLDHLEEKSSNESQDIAEFEPIAETKVAEKSKPQPVVKEEKVVASSNTSRKIPCGPETPITSADAPILFATGSDQIPEDAKKVLDGIAETMKTCSYTQLVLKGHADAQGGERNNLVLSIMRAYNVKYYLVSNHGISQQRINSRGLGESKPIADNQTFQGRNQNRRVDFQLVF